MTRRRPHLPALFLVLVAVLLAACSSDTEVAVEQPSNPYLDRTEQATTVPATDPSPSPAAEPSPSPSPSPAPSQEPAGPVTDPREVVDLSRPVVAPPDDWLGLATVEELEQSQLWTDQAAFEYFGEHTGEEKPATDTSLPEPPRHRWTNERELWNRLAPVWREDMLRTGPSWRESLFDGMPGHWTGGGGIWNDEDTRGRGTLYTWQAIYARDGEPVSRNYAALIKTQPDGSGELVAIMEPFDEPLSKPQRGHEKILDRLWTWAFENDPDA